jgi:hypothetical protein
MLFKKDTPAFIMSSWYSNEDCDVHFNQIVKNISTHQIHAKKTQVVKTCYKIGLSFIYFGLENTCTNYGVL